MRVLGIDPGYERIGVAIVEKGGNANKESVVFSDCIVTSRDLEHGQRLEEISSAVSRLIEIYKPEALSVESLFFNTNQKTALKVSEARGAILAAASKLGLPISEYTPLEIKIAITGYGRADKKQISDMVKRITAMEKLAKFDDEYDAIAVALTHLATKRFSNQQ